mgnify:CR=1 FL=1
MDVLLQLLEVLSAFTPLGVAALLGLALFVIIWKNPFKPVESAVSEIKDNHLHDIVHQLENINETLQRMEVTMSTEFSYLKARINGKH